MSDEFEPSAGTGDETPEMESPGARLREIRESHDLTLGQVALSLHVNESLLKSLEKDDYTALGAPIFIKGHLRNYAKLLEIDAAQVIRMYEKYHQPVDPALSNRVPDGPRVEKGGSGGVWLRWLGAVLLFILLVVLAGWWYYRQEAVPSGFVFEREDPREDSVEMRTDRQPQPLAAASDDGLEADPGRDISPQGGVATDNPAGVTESSGNTGSENVDSPTVVAGETSRPAPVREATPQDAAQTTTQAATQAEADVPRSSSDENAGSAGETVQLERRRILLEFSGESWVEVYDSEDQPLLYDLKAAGTQHTLEASGPIRLFLGNAPEVRITVDGESFDVAGFTRRDNTARFRIPPER